MISLMIVLVVIPLILRWFARRVERRGGPAEDRVHRLRVVSSVAMLVAAAGIAGGFFELRAEGVLPSGPSRAAGAFAILAVFGVMVAAVTMIFLAVHPTVSRLRGLRPQSREAGRRQARAFMVLMVPMLGWLLLLIAIRPVLEPKWLLFPLAVAWLLATAAFTPLLLRLALPSRPVPEPQRSRLRALFDRHGVAVRDVRIFETGPERMANAALAGFLPRFRYVLISDRLFEICDDEEMDAVVAHEMAHAKQHHLLIKLLVHMAVVVVLAFALAAAVALLDPPESAGSLLSVGFLLLLLVSFVVVHGALGLRLERRADDYAANATSPDALRRGLTKLAEANMMKRRTGKVWNLMQQHPGLEERIQRLSRTRVESYGRS